MHIPDGYLSPATCAVTWAAALPLWAVALRKVRAKLDETTLPYIASLTALSFVIMMFNIPIPGGTSGHAVGAVLLAILFGPWVAFAAVSMALLVQALLFGDGGVTTFAANALGMAAAGSFVGYWVFGALRRWRFAPFAAGYAGMAASSVVIAFLLGLQPHIAVDAQGKPLYFPFDLATTMTALVGAHLLFFAPVEGLFTQLGYTFLRRIEPELTKESA
ncbi:MAG: cobalt transporter CbiM [Epsilonproteobacteria bacterium]|nr:cobalt transporter CbiM [Campylobacterota bacterium]